MTENTGLAEQAWRDLEIAANATGALECARLTLPGEKVRALVAERRTAHSSGVKVKEWPEPGDKMRFLNRNGYDAELALAREKFEIGRDYTVKHFQLGDWTSFITFEEVPGSFNSVMFDFAPAEPGVEGDAKPVGYARSVDVDPANRPFEGRNSFWCSERKSAYYDTPLYAHPSLLEEWRDMDSAPKDGAAILYCTKFLDIGFCYWDEGYNEDDLPCWWDNERDDEVCPIAWLPADTLPPVRALLTKLEAGR